MNEDLILIKKLESLRAYHAELDHKIDHNGLDEFTKQRLKRERLQVRDQIVKISQVVYPDIIA